ncbi:MAG: hypothetical protein M1546_02735 [Chloroflexi bacterium]|nr:hypothetical protein [Chloroflexota bacterium]
MHLRLVLAEQIEVVLAQAEFPRDLDNRRDRRSLRDLKILGDGVQFWWAIIAAAAGAGFSLMVGVDMLFLLLNVLLVSYAFGVYAFSAYAFGKGGPLWA